ncbi:MAG: winged helix-turn-helix domain-containing protein [Pseudomonadota bacterium]|nr:winged helix-turn-helix domain-containing protein [Pseudomonadota bacterium]
MPTGNSEGAIQIGEWIADPSLDTISKGTETQKLEPRTMRLLLFLANSAGEVVSVDRLLTEVWPGVIVGSASVYQAVSQLRKLLGDVDPNPTYIATVPRKGYRIIAPVRRLEVPGEPGGIARVAEAPVVEPLPPAYKRKVMPIILGSVALIALLAAGALVWKKSTGGRLASAANSIVVLPFIDMTAEKTDQSFCDGLTEELSNWLAQIPTLRVVARTSAFAFRGQGEDVRKIGKALDTNHVLEGSMRRSGDHMRITVQLIDARSGYHLWSEDFDQPVADAIKMQEDISRSVAKTLQVRLNSDSERQLAERHTSDPQAYQLYLLGRYYQQQLTPKSTERAIDLFRQVLVADPKFAPAYIQLANALLTQRQFRDLPIAEVAAEVEPLINAALRIDDRLSGAYAARGSLRAEQSRGKEALSDLQLAISLNPSDMGAIARIGRIQLFDGQPREALKSYDRAATLDPLNFTLQLWRCTALEDLAQYEAAEIACGRARVLQPGSASVADRLHWLAESRGRLDEALRWNAESIKAEPSDDFDLYWNRATLFLSVGLASPARAAVDSGLSATKDDVGTNAALVRVVYCEGGKDALRTYLGTVHLDQFPYAVTLQEAAYARLLLDDAPAVKGLIERALKAPDRLPGFAEIPWYARGARAMGISYRVDLAVAYLALGDHRAAERELDIVLAMVNKMFAAGVERYATYALRAKVYALQGKSDEAMQDLNTAVRLGWRHAWWAVHEPYLTSLRGRNDFQALMTRVNRSNDQLIKGLKADPSGYFARPVDSVSSCNASG